MASTVVITIKARKEWEGISTSFLSDAINWLLQNVNKAAQFAPTEFRGFDPAKKHWFRRIYENLLSRVTKSVRLPIELANRLKAIPNWQETIRNIIDNRLKPDYRAFDEDAYQELCYQCFKAVEAKNFITVHSKGEWKEMLINLLDDLYDDFLQCSVFYDDLEDYAIYLIDRKNRLLQSTGKPTWLTSLYATVARTIRTFIQ